MTNTDGKKAVLLLLSTRHADLVRYIARRYQKEIGVEDIVQDVFLRIQQMPAQVEIVNPWSYLLKMADNLAKDRIRSQRTRARYIANVPAVDLHHAVDDTPLAEHIVDYRQRLARLEKAIADLPSRQKQVFLMNKFDGLSHSEIALELGITKSAVEKLIMKALAHCRDCLGDLTN